MKTLLASLAVSLLLSGCAQGAHSPASYPEFKTYAEQDSYLVALLRARKYDEIDGYLDRQLKRYEADPTTERWVDLALDAFYRADADFEPLLNEWVAKRGRSYAPYLVRGLYYDRKGWSHRGTRYIHETTRQQIDGMAFYFEKALKDLDRAYEINNRLVHVLCYKMEILMNAGAHKEIRAMRDRALTINPLSLTARWYYMTTVLPRWGGSMEALNAEIEAARPYFDKNLALKQLEGRLQGEAGDQALFSVRTSDAIRAYSLALKFGPNWFYAAQRGEAYSRINAHKQAVRDLTTAIELRPNFQRAFYMRGFSLYATRQLQESLPDLTEAVTRDPNDHKAWDIRGDAYLQLGKADLALADFEKALALQPGNPEYQEDVKKAKAALARK